MLKKHNLKEKQKIIRLILIGIIAAAALFGLINNEHLLQNPFKTVIELDEPSCGVQNEDGTAAVLDSKGSRVLILSPEDTVNEIITSSRLMKNTPKAADTLAIDTERLYILDHTLASNGTTIEGDRVLVYCLDGKFDKVLINSDTLVTEEHTWRIVNLATDEGQVYAVMLDDTDPTLVAVADITTGSLNVLHTLRTDGKAIFNAFYSPESDAISAIAHEGTIFIWKGETPCFSEKIPGTTFLNNIAVRADGSIIALDINNGTIWRYLPDNNTISVLTETIAYSFSICEDILISTDPVNYILNRCEMSSGKQTSVGCFTLSRNKRVMGYMTWGIVIIGLIAVFVLLLSFIFSKREEKDTDSGTVLKDPLPPQETATQRKEKGMTNAGLYGKIFLVFLFSFAITAIFLGKSSYDQEINEYKTTVNNAGYAIREVSCENLGDALSRIHGQEDYGSVDYQLVVHCTSSICMSDLDTEGSLNLPCQVYRFSEGSNEVMVVTDPTGKTRIGTILTEEGQEKTGISPCVEKAKQGKATAMTSTYKNGTKFYKVYEPVYNAAGEVVGMAVPMMNLSLADSRILDTLSKNFVTLFTLMAGLLMLAAEISYFLKVRKLKREKVRQGIKKKTIVEIDRTLNILCRLPGSVFLVFCTLITSSILESQGINNALLLALPLTIDGIFYSISCSCAGPIVKYQPKKCMIIGMIITGACFLLLGASVMLNNYILMIGAAVLSGGSCGFTSSSVKTIQFSAIKPDNRFSMMLFTKLEPAIASAIGASIGSVLRSIWGDKAMIIYVLIICLIFILIAFNYVYGDIAAEKDIGEKKISNAEKKPLMQRLKANTRYYFKPDVICMLVAGLIPISILSAMSSYVMPLFNNSIGLSDVYIGLITFIIQMISIFVVPWVLGFIISGKHRESFWIAIMMGTLALTFGIFGMKTKLITMVLILAVNRLVSTSINVMLGRMNMREAKNAGLNPNDTNVGFEIASNGAGSINNVILGLMIIPGYSIFGFIWCGICTACAVTAVVLNKISSGKEPAQA